MTRTTGPIRPSWRQRAADGAVARATKVKGRGQAYTRFTTSVPMRDGATLLADVYQPEQARATVLIRSPYGRGFPLDLLHARVFARQGYQVVVQSVRGRSGSTGEFVPVVNEAADGQDTVAWLRNQDWYAGRLATFGGSYLGMTQWALLADPPEDCTAAVIVVGPHDFSRAIWRAGAFALNDMFSWSLAMAAPEGAGALRQVSGMRRMHGRVEEILTQRPALPACETALAEGAPWFRDWLDHDKPSDPFWDAYRASDALKNSEVPTLLVGGWRDAFLDQTLEQYDALRSRNVDVALTVGPWTHMETATKAALHVTREALEWFDHCFAGGVRSHSVRTYVTGAEEWRSSDELPAATSTLELRLATGRLVEGADDGERTSLVFDPADLTPALGGNTLDPTSAGAKNSGPLIGRADVVAFTGDALTHPLELRGTPELDLRLTATNPSADVFVRLCDVDPKGRSVNIADAFARLDQRVPAEQEQLVHLTLDPCWHRLKSGHRLQLLVAGGAYPRFAPPEGAAVELQPRTILHQGTTLRLPACAE